MVTIRQKITRPHGVTAKASVAGQGTIIAASGASAVLAVGQADMGLTPVELLDAALAGCLAISIRYAAKQRGLADRAGQIEVHVDHEKAAAGSSRIVRFHVDYIFGGDITPDERAGLIAEGHRLCTIGNTLAAGAEIVDGGRSGLQTNQ